MIILKGVVTNLSLDPNGEVIATVSSPPAGQQPIPAGETYKFERYCHINVRASDLGNPPVGATVDVKIALS